MYRAVPLPNLAKSEAKAEQIQVEVSTRAAQMSRTSLEHGPCEGHLHRADRDQHAARQLRDHAEAEPAVLESESGGRWVSSLVEFAIHDQVGLASGDGNGVVKLPAG